VRSLNSILGEIVTESWLDSDESRKGRELRTIYCFPLEHYEERYTGQLMEWTERRFNALYDEGKALGLFISGNYPPGDSQKRVIKTGGPLDCFERTSWAMSQLNRFIEGLSSGQMQVTNDDIFYFQDMFHPGIESLPYIFHQLGVRPKIYAINWAQSVDVYDFTFPMRKWMRHYEMMVASILDGLFVASHELKDLCQVAGYPCKVHSVGLPYDSAMVRDEGPDEIKSWSERSKRIIFSSRLDSEKQPWIFFELARSAQTDPMLSGYEFAICSGNPELRSNSNYVCNALEEAKGFTNFKIYINQSKSEYHALLADSQLHFNCAKQDWVSFTMLDAATFGVPSLVPAFRGFPDAMEGSHEQMYIPWSLEDALLKMKAILFDSGQRLSETMCKQIAMHHDLTLNRHMEIMLGE
jgi:hypothetical protein